MPVADCTIRAHSVQRVASVSGGPFVVLERMPFSRSLLSRRSNWLFTAFAVFATVVQLVVALAPLGEGRVARTLSAHVETGGATGHVSHNEATCASCQARSIHGTISRPAVAIAVSATACSVAVAGIVRVVSTDLHLQSNPRTPPVVI
jgi:hypothetical protein